MKNISCVFLSVVSFWAISGCNRDVPGPPDAPSEVSAVLLEARDLAIEASVGGYTFAKPTDIAQFRSQFPAAANAIESGELKMLWGEQIREGKFNPEILIYESGASTSEGWALKNDAKFYKVTAQDIAALPKSSGRK